MTRNAGWEGKGANPDEIHTNYVDLENNEQSWDNLKVWVWARYLWLANILTCGLNTVKSMWKSH